MNSNVWSAIAFIISLFALLISALSYYWTHHHVSKKLFAFINLTFDIFIKNSISISIVNAGNCDIVLMDSSLDIRGSKPGVMSRDTEKIEFDMAFKGLLNPGDAVICSAVIDPSFDDIDITNLGVKQENGKYRIKYEMSLTWCDSRGKLNNSKIELGSVVLDGAYRLCGFDKPDAKAVNLYDHIRK